MKSWKIPTAEQVEKAIALIGRAEHYRLFFDRLENPNWISRLHAKGYFKKPPATIEDKVKATVSFPLWPESRYLIRVAKLAPDEVLSIVLKMEETNNTRIHEDFVDIALNIPARKSKALVDKVKKWILPPYHFLLPKKVGDLVAHLAKGGEAAAAQELAEELLDILPDPKKEHKHFSPNPKPKFDDYDYEEILKNDFPELLKASGIKALKLVCDLLNKHTRLSRTREEDAGPTDHSHVWRPSIDKFQHLYPVRDALVNAIRDSAQFLLSQNVNNMEEIVQVLDANKWDIFERIALYLLAANPSSAVDSTRRKLTDKNLFESFSTRSEYIKLARAGAKLLTSKEREEIFSWIAKGPDIEQFQKNGLFLHGKEREQSEIEDYKKRWKREKLFWFADILTPELKTEYEELKNEFGGDPAIFEFEGVKTAWVSPATPKSSEEIKNMPPDDLFAFLKEWKPDEESNYRNAKEGLVDALSAAIAQEPNKFAEHAHAFKDLDTAYIQALLRGLKDAIRQNKEFVWPPVLELMLFIAKQSYKVSDQRAINNSSLKYAKDEITRLLEVGFQPETKNFIPQDLRESSWEVIDALLQDPDPLEDSAEERSKREPITDSINSVRPLALHTAVRYALWRYRDEEKKATSKSEHNFKTMPEVQKALDYALHDKREAVRSAYGQWFPWIRLLDTKWATDNVAKIFMTDAEDTELGRTAWESYIVTVAPYDDTFNILKEQYLFAARWLNKGIFHRDNQPEAERSLAQHLMTFYWRGRLLDTDPIWKEFWKNASPKLKGQALDYIGRSFEATKEPAPTEIKERVVRLWETRLKETQAATDKTSYLDEMASFGWWFNSGKFDPQWAIKQLQAALEITPKIDAAHLIMKQLSKCVQQWPVEVMKCLLLLIRTDDPWAIHMWREEAKEVLSLAVQSNQPEAVTLAENIIHELGSLGHLEFGDLLQ